MNWQDKPLFWNRPPYGNAPLKVEGGFTWATGTQTFPLGYYYLNNFSLGNSNMEINLSGVDSWGYIGDRMAGTWAGQGTIHDILKDCFLYNGFTSDKLIIDNVVLGYYDAALTNSKPPEYAQNNGGYGEAWSPTITSPDVWKEQSLVAITSDITTGVTEGISHDGWYYAGAGQNINIYGQYDLGNYNNIIGIAKQQSPTEGNVSYVLTSCSNIINGNGTMKMKRFVGYALNKTVGVPFGDDSKTIGFFWDAQAGTGHYIRNEGSLAIIYSFDSALNWAAGSMTLGTFTCYSAFVSYLPYDFAQGTTKYAYNYIGVNADGTFLFRYIGSTAYHGTLWDKGTMSDIYNNAWAFFENNIMYYAGQKLGGISWVYNFAPSDFPNKISRNIYHWETANVNKRFALYGLSFQHKSVANLELYANGTTINAGSYYVMSGSSQIAFNFHSPSTDYYTGSYTVPSVTVNVVGSNYTLKNLCEKLGNVAGYISYFDGEGNYHFKNRYAYQNNLTVSTGAARGWGTGLVECPISASISKDTSRVKNEIMVFGSVGSSGANYFIDTTSEKIYGTRKYEYTNEFLITAAQCQVVGSMLLAQLKNSKPIINAQIPFHPEIEVLDGMNYYDAENGKTANGLTIKKVSHDCIGYTTSLSAEGYKSEELG